MENPSERSSSAASGTSKLCLVGCGFYGSHATEGLCSKCYKQSAKNRSDDDGSSSASPSPSPSSSSSSSTSATVLVQSNAAKPIDVQEQPQRPLAVGGPVAPGITNIKSILTECKNDNDENDDLMAASSSSVTPSAEPAVNKSEITRNAKNRVASNTTLTATGKQESVAAIEPLPRKMARVDPDAVAPPPVKKNRCAECRKKIGLTGFECRCGGMYCGMHRYSDMHQCSFDYKKLGEDEIRKANPIVQAAKINQI